MSRAELKANTVNDPKFWLGLIVFIVSFGTTLWGGAIGVGKILQRLDNLESIPGRMNKVENKLDGLDARINHLEFRPNSADNNRYFRDDPNKP